MADLKKPNKPAIYTILTAVLIAAMVFQTPNFAAAQTQTETVFETNDAFSIPQYNGVISFAGGGTYEQATLQNDSWTFVNLYLNSMLTPEKLNLTASAQNSNIAITLYRTYNTTFGGVNLRYIVEGAGTQTFNFGEVPKLGEWSVVINGVYIGVNDGWTISPNSTVTLTAAKGNVSIAYYTLPDSFGNPRPSSQSFFEQHSVIITTAAILSATIVVAVAIWGINRKKQETKTP